MSEPADVTEWIVTANGDEVGRFDNLDDAESMAAVWNHAYPHEPWFKVEEKP